MKMDHEDRMWLEMKFNQLHERINEQGSKVNKIDNRVGQIERVTGGDISEVVDRIVGAVVDKKIEDHEKASASHNPVKALKLVAIISAGLAATGKLIHSIVTFSGQDPPKP